jgi:hypothetical protein
MTQLTTAEAAALLGVTMSRVRYLCIDGVLNAEKRDRDWIVKFDEAFEEYASRETRAQGRGRPREKEHMETVKEWTDAYRKYVLNSHSKTQLAKELEAFVVQSSELRRQRDEVAKELSNMLHVFDRGLQSDTVGRKVCDDARRILAQYEEGDA